MSERSLGDRWAASKDLEGAWTCKLPASVTAGIPDWLLLNGWASLWEAKLIKPTGEIVFNPKAKGVLTGAQRFILQMLARYAPMSGGVLLLGPDGYWEVPAERALRRIIKRATFNRNKEPYRDT